MENLPLQVQALLSGAIKHQRGGLKYGKGWRYCPKCTAWFKTGSAKCPVCRCWLRTKSRKKEGRFHAGGIDPEKYGVNPEEI